jgi:hypothetical protein
VPFLNELWKISFQKENIFLFVKQTALHEILYKMNVQIQGLCIVKLTAEQQLKKTTQCVYIFSIFLIFIASGKVIFLETKAQS